MKRVFGILILSLVLLCGCGSPTQPIEGKLPSYTGNVPVSSEDEFRPLYLAVAQESTRCGCREFQVDRGYNPLGANVTYLECPRAPQFPNVEEAEVFPQEEYSTLVWDFSEQGDLLGAIYLSHYLVQVSNLTPGNTSATYSITVYNGGETTRFAVYYDTPGGESQGYIPAPAKAKGWVEIPKKHLLIPRGESQDVDITVKVPEGESPPNKWEFWVVIEKEPSGHKFPCVWRIEMGA